MKLIDLLSLLASPCSTVVDLYDDEVEGLCIWTGRAGDIPAELHDRTVKAFEPNPFGLNIDVI